MFKQSKVTKQELSYLIEIGYDIGIATLREIYLGRSAFCQELATSVVIRNANINEVLKKGKDKNNAKTITY